MDFSINYVCLQSQFLSLWNFLPTPHPIFQQFSHIDIPYRAILFDKMDINEGMILENAVAQMLRRRGHKLYFYSRSDSANRENHMEIDFLIAERGCCDGR